MIHSTAVIEKGAELGVDCEIGPFAYVAAKVRLGDGCRLGPHAVVLDGTTMGAKCVLHPGAVIGDLPQDLSFGGWESFVEIGEDCTFREGVTVHRGAAEGSVTRIGNHVYMMANSHAAHNTSVGDHVIMANGALLGGHVQVGERCFCGGGSAVHQFCHIGRYAMIAGVVAITKDVPPFCMTSASGFGGFIAGLNVVGLRRGGFTATQRAEIKQIYQLLYRSGLNMSQARDKMLAEMGGSVYAQEFAAFIASSKRGLSAEVRRVSGRTAAEGGAEDHA